MELRALTRRAPSPFPEQCSEPTSRRVGKADARHSSTPGQDSYPASPAPMHSLAFISAGTHQQWFNLEGKAVTQPNGQAGPRLRRGGKLRQE